MAKKPVKGCKTCQFLRTPQKAGEERVVRPGHPYACVYQVPDIPLPDSITRAFGFTPINNPRMRSSMRSGDGMDCPTYQLYDPKGNQ